MFSEVETACKTYPEVERRRVERLDSRCQDVDVLRSSLPLLSPKRLLKLMAFSIFLSEAIIMFLLAYLPELPTYVEALLDSASLLIILSPTFYFFHYRPLMLHYEDRKEIVEHLCDSEERLNLALNAVNDGLWDWNMMTGDVYVSVRAATMLGFEPGELTGNIDELRKRIHPEDRDWVDQLLKEHLDGETDHYRAEHRLRVKDGSYIWVLARGQVVSRGRNEWPLRMIGTFTDISPRKEAEKALRRSEADIRRLSRVLMSNSEAEKKHLAQDLHDEFGQVLCAFRLGVEMLRDHNYGPPDQYEAQCERLIALVERLEVDLRHMCDHLRPVMLDDLGLVQALKWHIEQFGEQNPDVRVGFTGANLKVVLPHEKEIALYRICQEALNNISKYADAQLVDVELLVEDDVLRLLISDDGVGFNEEAVRRRPGGWGLGLLGMRERAAAIGGALQFYSAPGEGTRIEMELSLQGDESGAIKEAVA